MRNIVSFFCLVFPLFCVSERRDNRENTSAIHEDCDCEAIKRGEQCIPQCFTFCKIGGDTIREATDHVMQCQEREFLKKTINDNTEVKLKKIPSTLNAASDRVVESGGFTYPTENCEHCHGSTTTMNQTQPKEFKPNSCKHIGTYDEEIPYKYPLKAGESCDSEMLEKISNTLSSDAGVILSDPKYSWFFPALTKRQKKEGFKKRAKVLYKKCPGNCSFYTDTVITTNEKDCSGVAKMEIRCGHKRKGSEYLVSVAYRKEIVCKEENTASLHNLKETAFEQTLSILGAGPFRGYNEKTENNKL